MPDSSLLLAGLDGMSSALLKRHHALQFRMSLLRNELRLDIVPTEANVVLFAQSLQAEASVIAVSGEDPEVKRPRISAMDAPSGAPEAKSGKGDKGGDNPKGKGKGKGDKGNPKTPPADPPNPKSAQPSGKGTCTFFLRDHGCSKGPRCTFYHDRTNLTGRCYQCGSTKHVKSECRAGAGAEGGGSGSTGSTAGAGAAPSTEAAAKSAQPPPKNSPNPKSAQPSGKGTCTFFLRDHGCSKGPRCTFYHDRTNLTGRCYQCGSTKHVKSECRAGAGAEGGGSGSAGSTAGAGTTPSTEAAAKSTQPPPKNSPNPKTTPENCPEGHHGQTGRGANRGDDRTGQEPQFKNLERPAPS